MSDESIQPSGEEIEGFVSTAPTAQLETPKTERIRIHKDPRISANKLAEYIIADPSRQKRIIKEAKFAQIVLTVPYRKTRDFIPYSFTANSLNIDKLVLRAEAIERENEDPEISDWKRDDNARSALALRRIAAIAPELSWKNGQIIRGSPGGMVIAGVQVSIQPDVVFSFQHRGVSKIGAIILNTAMGDEKSLARNNGSYCIGDYVSSLLFQMLLSRQSRLGTPLNSKCYAVDVFRGKIYTAPASYQRLNKNVVAACEVIASRWSATEFEG